MTTRLRLGVIRVYREEDWPSMDLCADQLLKFLHNEHDIEAVDLSFEFRTRFQRIPWWGHKRVAYNADRLLNRHYDLLKHLRRVRHEFDWFHVVDHSYAMVGKALPQGRYGVFCHDLDAFRCLLEPERERRPWWFRHMTRRVMAGVLAARVVFHSTRSVRQKILHHQLVPEERLVEAPYGIAEEFTVDCSDTAKLKYPYLLHVGSGIPRKRLEVLLSVFAQLRYRFPELRLIQIGGMWSDIHRQIIHDYQLEGVIEQRRGLTRPELAALYRGASVVLLPSEAEGFGLPLVEALACGAPVIASDLPVFREVGGQAVIYQPVANVPAWVDAVASVLVNPSTAPARSERLLQARRYSWANHAHTIAQTYLKLNESAPRCVASPV